MFPVGSELLDGGSNGDSDGGPDGARSSSFSLSKLLTDFRPEDHLGTTELIFGNSFAAGDFFFMGGGSEAGRLAFHRG